LTGKQANQDAVDNALNDRKSDASSDDLPFWIPKLWIDTLKLRKEWIA
jgi:hypothetical protein